VVRGASSLPQYSSSPRALKPKKSGVRLSQCILRMLFKAGFGDRPTSFWSVIRRTKLTNWAPIDTRLPVETLGRLVLDGLATAKPLCMPMAT
jgi:hypothetical protein